MIKRLVSPNPEVRPTASELLEEITVLHRPAQCEENESKSTTIRNLERELKSKNEEIASLKQKILALEAESSSH